VSSSVCGVDVVWTSCDGDAVFSFVGVVFTFTELHLRCPDCASRPVPAIHLYYIC